MRAKETDTKVMMDAEMPQGPVIRPLGLFNMAISSPEENIISLVGGEVGGVLKGEG